MYTREAHPGEHLPAHESFAQKRAHARRFQQRWSIERPIWVDDLEGTVHRAYGALPNMAWIVDSRGRIAYKANWTDARSIEAALGQVMWEEAHRAAGRSMAPFHVEMSVERLRDRPAFLEGLLEAGPRAVEEFIDAGRENWGEGPVRPMEQWWAARKG